MLTETVNEEKHIQCCAAQVTSEYEPDSR